MSKKTLPNISVNADRCKLRFASPATAGYFNRLEAMIFALSTDDKTLMIFVSEAEATAYVEVIDVEDGVWLFFDDCGFPLTATFSTPNKRSAFCAESGVYHLQSSQGQNLSELLPEVASIEGAAPENTVVGVMTLLVSNIAIKRDAPQSARPLP